MIRSLFAITLATLVSSHDFKFQRALSVRDENTNIISDTYISQHFELDNGAVHRSHTHTQTHTTHTHAYIYKQMIFTKVGKHRLPCPRVITRSPDFGREREREREREMC